MFQSIPHIEHLYNFKKQYVITKDYVYKNFIEKSLFYEKVIKNLFAHYPTKDPQEGCFSYGIKVFSYAIKPGWTTEYLDGCYNLGSEVGSCCINLKLFKLSSEVIFLVIGLAFQIAKYLLIIIAQIGFYTVISPFLITALIIDRMIRCLLYFTEKNQTYNQAINNKITNTLPEKFSSFIQKLRGYSIKIEEKIEEEPKKEKEPKEIDEDAKPLIYLAALGGTTAFYYLSLFIYSYCFRSGQ